MDKLIDAALGIHPQAMALGSKRLELIAGNLANADTPGYKARDIDFRAAMNTLLAEQNPGTLRTTRVGHESQTSISTLTEPAYRVPNLPSLDGNTVDAQLEQSAFSEASVRYQVSVDFLDARVRGLRKALRGE
jgi:flagellar basal-body rod protein FlgB